jgi:hypothetical protein
MRRPVLFCDCMLRDPEVFGGTDSSRCTCSAGNLSVTGPRFSQFSDCTVMVTMIHNRNLITIYMSYTLYIFAKVRESVRRSRKRSLIHVLVKSRLSSATHSRRIASTYVHELTRFHVRRVRICLTCTLNLASRNDGTKRIYVGQRH